MIHSKKIQEVIKKEGLKGFFERWKDGIKKVSQEDIIKAEMIAHAGMLIGTILAVLFFIFISKPFWILAIPLGFNIILQITALITKYQQLAALKDLKNKIEMLKGGQNV